MKSNKPKLQEPNDKISVSLDMMTIACSAMSFLGFWILMATNGKDASWWIRAPGWYFLLAGGATLVVIYYGRYMKGDLHRKLHDALR